MQTEYWGKIKLALKLEKSTQVVDIIEAGTRVSSPGDFKSVEISRAIKNAYQLPALQSSRKRYCSGGSGIERRNKSEDTYRNQFIWQPYKI